MSEHPIAQQIIDEIKKVDGWYEVFEHEPVRTSEDAFKVRSGYTRLQGTKALIVRAKIKGEGRRFVMLVMPGDRRFDSKKAKTMLNAADLRFASEEEVEDITDGIKPGGVPPFGNLFGLEVFADGNIFDDEKIIFNAGRNYSIAMHSADYRKIVDPSVVAIV